MSYSEIYVTRDHFSPGEADDYLMVLAQPPMSAYASRVIGGWLRALPGVGFVASADGLIAARANPLIQPDRLQRETEAVVRAYYEDPALQDEVEDGQVVARVLRDFYQGQLPEMAFQAARVSALERFPAELVVGTTHKFTQDEQASLASMLSGNTNAWGVEFGRSGHNIYAGVPAAFVEKGQVAEQIAGLLRQYIG